MAIMASDTGGGGDFSPMPSGNHVAVCNMVVDLGMQRDISPQYGEKIKHKIWVRWEVPAERLEWTDKDGNQKEGPRVIGKTYTLSLHENANLRTDLENWRGKPFTDDERAGFDVSKLLGAPCMLNVIHTQKNGKTYADVKGIGKLPKGMEAPMSEIGLVLYDDENTNNYEHLSEWLQKKIDAQVRPDPNSAGDNAADDYALNDDIPF